MEISSLDMKAFLAAAASKNDAVKTQTKDNKESFSAALNKSYAKNDKESQSAVKTNDSEAGQDDAKIKEADQGMNQTTGTKSLGTKEIAANNNAETAKTQIKTVSVKSAQSTEKLLDIESLDINSLLALLAQIMNGKLDIKELTNKLEDGKLGAADINTLLQGIKQYIAVQMNNSNTTEDTNKNAVLETINKLLLQGDNIKVSDLPEVIKEFNRALESGAELLNNFGIEGKQTKQNFVKQVVNVLETKLKAGDADLQTASNSNLEKSNVILTANTDTSSTKNDKGDSKKNLEKDDKILTSLLSKDKDTEVKDNKITRITNFMTQFNSIKDSSATAEINNLSVNKSNFVNDVIKTVKFMETNNLKDLTVKIVPKELGEITIKIVMEGSVMKANITTANKEAYNLINSNLQDLNGKLNDQDIKIQNFTLNIYNDDTTFFKQGSDRQNDNRQSRKRSGADFANDEEEIEAVGLDSSNVNILV